MATQTWTVCWTSSADLPGTASRLCRGAALLLVGAPGCRSPSDHLAGDWAGTLVCDDGSLVYDTVATLRLEAPSGGRHSGTLSLQATWVGIDGSDLRQSTSWRVTLRQSYPRGRQEVDFVEARCGDAVRTSNGEPVAEGCTAVGAGIGTSSLVWNGADALTWDGSCRGALVRGEIEPDSAGPTGDLR